MGADELLDAGDVEAARAALIEAVKRAPQDQGARMFLWQLQAVCGAWDKAQAQMRVLAQLSPEAQMLAVAYNPVIDAERQRAEVFAGRAPPVLLVQSDWAGDLAAALGALCQGRAAEAEARRNAALEAAPDTPGELDGRRFDWIADADLRFGPALEAVIAGRWGLLPFDVIEQVTSDGARDLRDLVWLPVQIAFKSGRSVAAFLPTRYPGSDLADGGFALARRTDWRDGSLGDEGLGQHVFGLSDGSEADLLSLRKLRFD